MHHYSDDAAILMARDGQNPGKSERSVTDPPPAIPLGYLPVLVGNKYVLLTREECITILKRGRRWRKVMAKRQSRKEQYAKPE